MLPTCPACKQSVLDDDATECPFCGANMKTGKGGAAAKPAASKPAAAAPAAKSAAPAKPASKPASPARKPSLDDDDDDPFSEREDDDPFAAATKQDAANRANAIAVSPKKTKTHVVELKCPMCDTVGFVPENSGGKDVKCANPACTVPVFMAPKNFGAPAPVAPPPKQKTVAASSGPSKKPFILAIVGGVALVAVVGLGVYFWPDGSGSDPKAPNFKELAEKAKREREAAGLPPVATANVDGNDTSPKTTEGNTAAQTDTATAALDVNYILKLMDDLSAEEQLANKKFCRQRAAIAFATMGDAPGMRDQFDKLDTIDTSLPHFKMPAYLVLAWRQLSTGDKAGAAKLADEALQTTAKIGKGSRDTQEAVIDLAALLVATGRTDDARKLIAEHFVADASTPLIVAVAHARHRKSYDLADELPGAIGKPDRSWGVVGVTLILTDEGLWSDAQLWAEGITDPESRNDAVLTLSDAKARDALTKKQPLDSTVEGIGEKLTPGGKVQLLARLAMTAAHAGQNADADRLIAAAKSTLAAIPVPEAARCDGFKEALDWKAPDPVPLRQVILGSAALGSAQVAVKKTEEGWDTIRQAVQFARAMAPSPAAVGHWKAQAEELGADGLRDEIRKLLSLSSRDEATRKAREVRNKLDAILVLAVERFHIQEAIFKHAIALGLSSQVWQETLSRSQIDDVNGLEPFIEGPLALHLIHQFTVEGKSKEVAEVQAKIEGHQLPPDELLELQPQVAAAVKNGSLAELIAVYNQRKLAGATEELALRGFSQAARPTDKAIPILALVMSMDTKTYNQIVKWEAMRMLAANAARHGHFAAVRDTILKQNLKPVEKISALLGVLEGYTTWQKMQPAPKAE